MNQTKLLALAAGSLLLTVGCAGSTVQYERVGMVKSAAIVGMAAQLNIENRTQGGAAGEVGAAQEMSKLGSDERIADNARIGDALYDALGAKLGEAMGWTVKARDEVKRDGAMTAMYTEVVGEPNSLQLGGKRVYTPGVLWAERVGGMALPERKKLFESLGVDSLIIADIMYYVGKTGPVTWKAGEDGAVTVSGPIPGTSAAYPAGRINLTVYDATSSEPIWRDSASGDPASIGIATSMGYQHDTDLAPILTEALNSAWETMKADYEAGKAAAAAQAAGGS